MFLLIKVAMRPWKKAFFQQIFTVLSLGTLLFLAGFFVYVQDSLNPVLDRLQTEKTLIAYLAPEVSPSEEATIVDTIHSSVGSAAREEAPRIQLVKQDQFLQAIEANYPDLVQELKNLGEDKNQVVPRYVSISGRFSGIQTGDLKKIPGVEWVESSEHRLKPLIGSFLTAQWGARILVGALLVAMIVMLLHFREVNAISLQDVEEIVSLWGGSRLHQEFPSLFSGALVGFLGGVLALGLWILMTIETKNRLTDLGPILSELKAPHPNIAILLLLGGVMLGLLSNLFGSLSNAHIRR